MELASILAEVPATSFASGPVAIVSLPPTGWNRLL
jgi:hypothetical protein